MVERLDNPEVFDRPVRNTSRLIKINRSVLVWHADWKHIYFKHF